MERLSLIIPTYNEASRIEKTLGAAIAHLKPRRPFELVVVDDGSQDQTADRVREFALRNPEIKLIALDRHRGKGAAVRQGMLHADGEFLCFSDADLSTPIEDIEKMLLAMGEGHDVAIASRKMAQSQILIGQGFIRGAMGKIFHHMTRILFGLPFRDTQCGFKCFRRRAARAIFSQAKIDGFAFDVEILVLAQRFGFSVAEVAVRWADSVPSRVNRVSDPLQMSCELWRIFQNLQGGLYDA